jgi:hypothetical protein
MAANEPKKASEGPLFHQPWPGYWKTKLKLARMVRFKHLIVRRENWAGDADTAPPLAELFPDENVQQGNFLTVQRINEEIKETMLMVYRDLEAIGIPTVVSYEEYDPVEGKDVLRKYNLIMDYYRLPRSGDGHASYQAVIDVLLEGIGAYKGWFKQAKRELFNPVIWAAYLIRIPITVMERAGFGAHEKTQAMMLGWYGRFVQVMMAIILGLFMVRQGIKFPWKEIFNWVMGK